MRTVTIAFLAMIGACSTKTEQKASPALDKGSGIATRHADAPIADAAIRVDAAISLEELDEESKLISEQVDAAVKKISEAKTDAEKKVARDELLRLQAAHTALKARIEQARIEAGEK